MGINIAICQHREARRVNVVLLRRIALGLLREELALPEGELSICLVDDDEMTKLNERFLRHAGTTDVITFNYRQPETASAATASPLHGEIFICAAEAVRQARRFGTSWQNEVVRYLVHGVLHLLGHDDQQPAPRRRMKRAENRLVRQLAQRFPLTRLAARG